MWTRLLSHIKEFHHALLCSCGMQHSWKQFSILQSMPFFFLSICSWGDEVLIFSRPRRAPVWPTSACCPPLCCSFVGWVIMCGTTGFPCLWTNLRLSWSSTFWTASVWSRIRAAPTVGKKNNPQSQIHAVWTNHMRFELLLSSHGFVLVSHSSSVVMIHLRTFPVPCVQGAAGGERPRRSVPVLPLLQTEYCRQLAAPAEEGQQISRYRRLLLHAKRQRYTDSVLLWLSGQYDQSVHKGLYVCLYVWHMYIIYIYTHQQLYIFYETIFVACVVQGRQVFEHLKKLESKGVGLQIVVNGPQKSTLDTADLAATGKKEKTQNRLILN